MSSYLVQHGATVLCGHAGQAQPTVSNSRVKTSGQATVALTGPWTISGCPLPANAGGPCATAQWSSGSVRVMSANQPLVIQSGSATCLPTGVPLNVVLTQVRVKAT